MKFIKGEVTTHCKNRNFTKSFYALASSIMRVIISSSDQQCNFDVEENFIDFKTKKTYYQKT